MLWSGHGYHIVIPVNCKEALERVQEFKQYTNEPSKEFLQFAERILSLHKADSANNPSFKSCLLRVPRTFNSKCIEEGIDAEVRVIQTFLVDKKLKAELKQEKNADQSCRYGKASKTTPYIESILNMQLSDHRKFIIRLILAPYSVNVQKLTDSDSFSRIKEWVMKCNMAKKLEPSINYFDGLIDRSIKRAKETDVKPLKFEETLQHKNRDLYDLLSHNK